jgi:hypothetical protein
MSGNLTILNLSCIFQNAGQNQGIKIENRSLENESQFRYLGTEVTNQNLIQEEIKRRLNSGNACYRSVQNLLLIILPVVSDIEETQTEGQVMWVFISVYATLLRRI